MGAFRKAGVWLGLVEEEDDPRGGAYDDEFGDEDDDYAPPARPRSLTRQRSERDIRIRDGRDGRDDRDDRGERRRLGERDIRLAEHPRSTDYGRSDLGRDDSRESRTEHARAHADHTRTDQRFDHARGDHARSDTRSEPARSEHTRGDQARGEHTRGDQARTDHGRSDYGRSDRGSVRQLSRPGTSSYPTQDNLALAPQQTEPQSQTHGRERSGVTEDGNCRITTLHPTSYSEARTIGEHFRDGYPVIMNLTEMDEPDAKRLVDFAAGLAFGLRGSMERVTNRVFLLSPPNIQVSAEDKARIAEGRFFQQP
jgi:cell division inhibitor SepF